MNRETGNRASLRCKACGNENDSVARKLAKLGKTYQVIVACSSCGTSFAVLSRN